MTGVVTLRVIATSLNLCSTPATDHPPLLTLAKGEEVVAVDAAPQMG